MNPVRPTSSFTSAKSKKPLKPKVKRKQQGQSSTNNINSKANQPDTEKDKGSPIKEFQDYAGIGSESTRIYAEQTNCSHISEEVCSVLSEDINYKLRHIIHECLVKSKLQGRDSITSDDVEETFSNLRIGRVYGAPSSPNWVPFRDGQDTILYHLDDQIINLIELAEKEFNVGQQADTVLDQVWLPDGNDSEDDMQEYNETLAEYFETMCHAVISDNEEIRHMALLDISTNPTIGPITDWFYHFSYFLLIKDVTYDRLTMRALHLLETLENSPLPNLHVYGKQLKLIVRLLLQRLLMRNTKEDIVKHMCYVLSLFCLRSPLKHMVLSKVEDKLVAVCDDMAVPLLNILYYIGLDAIKRTFLPNLVYFLGRAYEEDDPNMTEVILAIYGLLCKDDLNKGLIYDCYRETFGTALVPYYLPKNIKTDIEKRNIDIIQMKGKLIKTRRKVDYRNRTVRSVSTENSKANVEFFTATPHCCNTEIKKTTQTSGRLKKESPGGVCFQFVSPCCQLRRKLDNQKLLYERTKAKRETQVTIGKMSLLLSILKRDVVKTCNDHSLLNYYSL